MSASRPRLLFVTDSLGLPRRVPVRVAGHEVWVNQVAHSLEGQVEPYFYTVAGLHSSDLASNLEIQLGGFDADLLVLQIGIVDCAPKALRENERKVVTRLPGPLRLLVHNFLRRNYARIVMWRDVTYVSQDRFRTNLESFREHFRDCEFVVVPIAPANQGYRAKNPLIDRNIRAYNRILETVFGEAFASETFEGADPELLFVSDHHHLSIEGHATVARAVAARSLAALSRLSTRKR